MIADLLARGLLLASCDKSRPGTEKQMADKGPTMIRPGAPERSVIGGGTLRETA